MSQLWGIHNDTLNTELLEKGFISIGWDAVSDLTSYGDDRERIKSAVAHGYPDAKPGAIPVWAGMLRRFAFALQIDDLVVSPNKADSTLNLGRITGGYEYQPNARVHRHRRPVQWLKVGVARSLFTRGALNEIGSALTLFQVNNHASEFLRFLEAPSDEAFVEQLPPSPSSDEDAEAAIAGEPNAQRIDQHTRDFIASTLLDSLSHEEFEHFTADLLRCMGYQARVTQYSADGGVDVLAHKDPLGLEPPLIKVQCKHTSSAQGRPDVQRLSGTLATNEVGLFVTLGTYTREATDLERERQNLRLFTGANITELVLQHYAELPRRWRALLPLRPMLVVDRDPQDG